jgi:ATP-dependent Clp protease ATP-binding subunit ClpC
MFERYTENARKTIFFGRYEASQFGSAYITPEHLLLGMYRDDPATLDRALGDSYKASDVLKEVRALIPQGEKTSTSIDLPLSNESKIILAHATQAAEDRKDVHIGNEHLLFAIWTAEGPVSSILKSIAPAPLDAIFEHVRQAKKPHFRFQLQAGTVTALCGRCHQPAELTYLGLMEGQPNVQFRCAQCGDLATWTFSGKSTGFPDQPV